MLEAWQILTTLLVSVGMALSLAHALEFPGKLRLARNNYLAVQRIYYPGFTIGGAIGEFAPIVALLVLLWLTPLGSTQFWLTTVALITLIGMQGVYWAITHPINKTWLKGEELHDAGARFFETASGEPSNERDWTVLRDRWEYSHVMRAILAMVGFIALLVALVQN